MRRRGVVIGSIFTLVLLVGAVDTGYASTGTTEGLVHPTVLAGGAGSGVSTGPFIDQGAGGWTCYVAGVGALGTPAGVAILTQITSCTLDGKEAILLPITCPGSVCGYAWAHAEGGWEPSLVGTVCASGTATFVMADGSLETVSGSGCGPV